MNYLSLNDEKLLPVVIDLNTLLADYNMYYQKLRLFHWNILGKNFFDLHAHFEQMYTDARIKIDEIAERILTLRYHPMSKLSDYLKVSNISEVSPFLKDTEMIDNLISDHMKLLIQMRLVIANAEKAKDEGTIDLMSGYIRELEKSSWMLDAWASKKNIHLKKKVAPETV